MHIFDFDGTLANVRANNYNAKQVILATENATPLPTFKLFYGAVANGEEVYILTARQNTDWSRNSIIKFLANNGISFPPERVLMSGGVGHNKAVFIACLAQLKNPKNIHFYDDDDRNHNHVGRLNLPIKRYKP